MKRRKFLTLGAAGSGALASMLAGSTPQRGLKFGFETRVEAFPLQCEQGNAQLEVRSSLLVPQVGYHPSDLKCAYLRTPTARPPDNPTGQNFQVIDETDNSLAYAGTVEIWGGRWSSWL